MTKKGFQYRLLANEIKAKIQSGTYRSGEKLPSIRTLHKQLNLSISTIYKAFIELETTGLIEAVPKSGYYVRNWSMSDIEPPKTQFQPQSPQKVVSSFIGNEVHLARENPNYLPLGTAAVSPDLLPYKIFSKILNNISQQGIKSILSYNLPQGNPELRRQIALKTIGLIDQVTAEDIVVTNGCTEALALSLKAILKPEDTIAIESPTFYGILPVLEELKVYAVEIPTDPVSGINIEHLEKAIKENNIKACFLTPNFHNPLGALMPEEKKEKLVKLLNQFNIPIIEDDIYSELYFGKNHPKPFKAYDQKDLVITCSSFSKTLAAGLRIGWVIPGKHYKNKILSLKTEHSIGTSSLDQYILAEFLKSGGYERHLRVLRNITQKQVLDYIDAVKNFFPKHTKLAIPKGGFLLWIQLPHQVDSLAVYQQALEKQICILPGSICSPSNQFNDYIRLSCGYPFTKEVKKGIQIMGGIIEKLQNF